MSIRREELSYRIGERIREFRAERRLSQEMLALSSGMHPAYLGKIERGEKCPTIDTLSRICEGLKIPVHELLDFELEVRPTSGEALHRIENALVGVDDEAAVKIAEIVEGIAEIYKK
ncbi:MAG: helix-turn-helix transcriptional regulator [Oscillospiraceae bacterium]|nr:helix-turn-helix transcriptional regulator [Oscillospiraceae bacterium]